ncbi:MAG: tRNA 2-selenouridine(34) synthase MnmH [Chitinophagaceae bacterium]
MLQSITVEDFMKMEKRLPLADVRTPAEFAHGHVPGAINMPLFSNEERVRVGTTYKQTGREAAILLGFDLTGSKWSGFIREACGFAPHNKLAVHCWRGGMRSEAMAWALNFYGFDVFVLQGGYKQYRRWVLNQMEDTGNLSVVGGMTGSGKTRILHELRGMKEQVIDLEDLAQHQGSTYGSLNRLQQPSQEQFENNLAAQLHPLDRGRRIWLEDESLTIGRCCIPKSLWDRMQSAMLYFVEVPLEDRVQALVHEYGSLDKEFLVVCTDRIRKRLGPEQTKKAIVAIRENRMEEFVRLVLVYYDKTYQTGFTKRPEKQTCRVRARGDNPAENAALILHQASNF